eukprot:12580607-Alexandrium_andersonii.AAC.1
MSPWCRFFAGTVFVYVPLILLAYRLPGNSPAFILARVGDSPSRPSFSSPAERFRHVTLRYSGWEVTRAET